MSCTAPKNEDGYEISIPYEESNFEQQGFFSQTDQNFDGEVLNENLNIHFDLWDDLVPHSNILDYCCFPNISVFVLLRVAPTCWPISSQQLIYGDHQLADPAADLFREKLLAAEKD